MVVEKDGEIIINTHWCFEESTEVTREDGSTVAVKDLNEGERILSQKDGKKFYDKVIDATIIEGKVPAHKFEFANGKHVTATSPHLMMVWKGNEMEMVAAREVQVHDLMCFEDGKFTKVTKVVDVVLDRKVSVNTLSGTLYGNGVLTTGMCDNRPLNTPTSAKLIQMAYMESHKAFA